MLLNRIPHYMERRTKRGYIDATNYIAYQRVIQHKATTNRETNETLKKRKDELPTISPGEYERISKLRQQQWVKFTPLRTHRKAHTIAPLTEQAGATDEMKSHPLKCAGEQAVPLPTVHAVIFNDERIHDKYSQLPVEKKSHFDHCKEPRDDFDIACSNENWEARSVALTLLALKENMATNC